MFVSFKDANTEVSLESPVATPPEKQPPPQTNKPPADSSTIPALAPATMEPTPEHQLFAGDSEKVEVKTNKTDKTTEEVHLVVKNQCR